MPSGIVKPPEVGFSERRNLRMPRFDAYPERNVPKLDAVDQIVVGVQAWLVATLGRWQAQSLCRIVPIAAAFKKKFSRMDDPALLMEAHGVQRQLRMTNCEDIIEIARCFALVREASGRVLGLRHHDAQIIAGYALMRGMIAEMATGEGKTLAAVLPAITSSFAGWPVHVITVNDYLTQRDADAMRPIYSFFGLSVGFVVGGQTPEERRAAYACDISYCTNKEVAFDYLKDRILLSRSGGGLRLKVETLVQHSRPVAEQLLLRGLYFAIVDEADSVLIDEARIPLIISRRKNGSSGDDHVYAQAMQMSNALKEDSDFVVRRDDRNIVLTDHGCRKIGEISQPLDGIWRSKVLREELFGKAIMARLLYHRGEHYLVRNGKVEIIDEYTGRVMPERFWGEGIHQMIEVKEGCKVNSSPVTVARMTYQRFFRRYMRLSGMTGTCREVSRELWQVYRLAVAVVPPHQPRRLFVLRPRVLANQEAKWLTIVETVRRLQEVGRPVLVATRTVAASETAAKYLAQGGLEFALLNASQDAKEAEIVSEAGTIGRVTIATNMSGRGTDIRVGPDAAELGGLHVIMSERHESGRIDRQLAGRAGRQGCPGSFQAILSLDDPIIGDIDRLGLVKVGSRVLMGIMGQGVGRMVLWCTQRLAERRHARMRNDLLKQDEFLGRSLALSGKPE